MRYSIGGAELKYLIVQFQSHQLFHTFVVVAALVHLHGISSMAVNTLEEGSCPEQLLYK